MRIPLAALAVIVVAGIVYSFVASTIGQPPLLRDSLTYNQMAERLLNTGVFSEYIDESGNAVPTMRMVPGYHIFLASIYLFAGHDGSDNSIRYTEPILIVIQVFLALLALVSLTFSAKLLAGTRGAIIAAMLALLYVPYPINATVPLTETLNLFLISLCVLSGIAMMSQTRKMHLWMYAYCACGALAILVRPVVSLWLLVPLGFYAYSHWDNKKETLQSLAIGIGIIALVMSPWVVRNALTFHQFQPLSSDPNPLIDSVGGSEFGTAEEVAIIAKAKKAGKEPKTEVAKYRIAKALKEDPWGFIGHRAQRAIDSFIYPTLLPSDIIREMNLSFNNPMADYSSSLIRSDTFLPVEHANWFEFLWVYSLLIHRVLLVLATAGLIITRKKPVAWMLASMIPYYLIVHGAILAFSRYMYPTTLVLILLSTLAIDKIVEIGASRLRRDVSA